MVSLKILPLSLYLNGYLSLFVGDICPFVLIQERLFAISYFGLSSYVYETKVEW